MSAASNRSRDVIDLTLSDDDGDSEGERAPRPPVFRKPPALRPEPGVDARRSRDRSLPIRASPSKQADPLPGTPSNALGRQALNTPPPSHKTGGSTSQSRKRQRPRSESPSPSASGTAKKRAQAQVKPLATPPSTAEADASLERPRTSPYSPATPPPTAPRTGAAPVLQPRPIARRTSHVDGHPAVDATIFSPKPFKWQAWSAKDYLELSEALQASFDATQFAKQLSAKPDHRPVTTEEVSWVFRAAVGRPLRLLEISRERGERGMQELSTYFKQHGTEIRCWGSGYVIRGEFLGLEAGGVVLSLATTPYGKAEQDAKKWAGDDLIIDADKGQANLSLKLLCEDDVEYLASILSDGDVEIFAKWWNEIAADRGAAGGRRKDKGRASSGY